MSKKKKGKAKSGAKPNPLGLPELGRTKVVNGKGEELKRTSGQTATKEARSVRDVALEARCRQMGKKASDYNKVVLNLPYLSQELGRVLHHLGTKHDEILRLWQYWSAYCASQHTFHTRILGINPHPQCVGLQLVAERIEATAEDEPDTRTQEERDEDARRWHDHWIKVMDKGMDPSLRAALYAAELGDGPPLWRDGKPTPAGYVAAQALEQLAKLAER